MVYAPGARPSVSSSREVQCSIALTFTPAALYIATGPDSKLAVTLSTDVGFVTVSVDVLSR